MKNNFIETNSITYNRDKILLFWLTNMFYIYVLLSKNDQKIYTGYTKDLKARIKEHESDSVYTTKRMGEFELIYYEAFKSNQDATRREKYLKTTKGKRTLKLKL